ncbi:MAG: N-acetylmuramoyl-L-alanine amidase, partial [Oscillospiraceae bacterium]
MIFMLTVAIIISSVCNIVSVITSAKLYKEKCVIIDAGHGGFDPGAVANDVIEKEINLSIAL